MSKQTNSRIMTHVYPDAKITGGSIQGPVVNIGDDVTLFFKDNTTAIRLIAALADAVRLNIAEQEAAVVPERTEVSPL